MKVALLGGDDEVLALARELVAQGEEFVAVFEPGDAAFELHALAPLAQIGDEWETLLLPGLADVVLVGRAQVNDEVRADQLRKLAQAAVPLVIVHPACEYIIGYEIEMIRKDVGGIIIPYYPGIWQAALGELQSAMTAGVEQVVFERRLGQRQRDDVLRQFARDAEVIRRLLGPIQKISAIGSLPPVGTATLSVQMTSADGRLARWSLAPESGPPAGTLSLLGPVGKTVAALDEMRIVDCDPPPTTNEPAMRDAERLLVELTSAQSGQSPRVAWIDACRAMEITATAPRSVEKGKTIELYNEEHTAEGAFKGTMAVGGCLILMVLLLVTVFVALVEGLQLKLHTLWLWKHWILLLFAPMVLFLFLQVLGYLANRSRKSA
jgi:hypothetical protein